MIYKKAKDKPQDKKEIDDQVHEFLKERLYEYVEEQEEGIDKVKSRLLYFQNYAPQERPELCERVEFYSEIISLYEYFKEKDSPKEESQQGEKKTFKQVHQEREKYRKERIEKLVRIVQLSPKMWV